MTEWPARRCGLVLASLALVLGTRRPASGKAARLRTAGCPRFPSVLVAGPRPAANRPAMRFDQSARAGRSVSAAGSARDGLDSSLKAPTMRSRSGHSNRAICHIPLRAARAVGVAVDPSTGMTSETTCVPPLNTERAPRRQGWPGARRERRSAVAVAAPALQSAGRRLPRRAQRFRDGVEQDSPPCGERQRQLQAPAR